MDYFGPHWYAEAKGVAPTLIQDRVVIDKFMNDIVKLAGMQVIAGPLTVYYNHPTKPRESGVSSILLLADSHCSLHSFINDGWVFFDLFTCAETDHSKIDKLVLDTFLPLNYTSKVEWRGKGYVRKDQQQDFSVPD